MVTFAASGLSNFPPAKYFVMWRHLQYDEDTLQLKVFLHCSALLQSPFLNLAMFIEMLLKSRKLST